MTDRVSWIAYSLTFLMACCGGADAQQQKIGAPPEASNMKLVGSNDLQSRSAYQPTIHHQGDRWIAYIGHHGGTDEIPNPVNPITGKAESLSQSTVTVGAGYIAVFGVFVLLYWHAYRQREALELNELEVFDTRVDIRESALNVCIALLSITIAFIGRGRFAFLSGITYMLNGILSPLHGTMMGRRRRKLEEQFDAKRGAAPATD